MRKLGIAMLIGLIIGFINPFGLAHSSTIAQTGYHSSDNSAEIIQLQYESFLVYSEITQDEGCWNDYATSYIGMRKNSELPKKVKSNLQSNGYYFYNDGSFLALTKWSNDYSFWYGPAIVSCD